MKDKSRKPYYNPNQHTEEEIKMIKDYKNNNRYTGLIVLWIKLREIGYARTVQGLYHVLQRLGIYKKAPSKKKENEPCKYVTERYLGEKVQVDVKYVSKKCMSPELQKMRERYYQYTGIDEYTRIRDIWYTNEHSTYMSSEFIKRMVKYFREQYEIEIKTI
mgnify:FL=1